MAMANIDSSALFHDMATGADSTASGIVGLIGAALALQSVSKTAFVNDIVFAFWAGESWGYLGSKKFLSDIQNFQCKKLDTANNMCNEPYKPDLSFENIKLQNIMAAIELNQIGLTSTTSPALFIHQQSTKYNSVSSLLQSVAQDTPLEFKPVNNSVQPGIPPSSLMSFLVANPDLLSVVVTDHEMEYTNRNFHSHLDNGAFNKLSNDTLCHTATVLARTLYLMATGQTTPDTISPTIEAPCSLLSDLAYCLSENFDCPLLDNFLPRSRPPIPSYYTGVFGYSIDNAYASAPAVLVSNMMTLITAENVYYNFSSNNFSIPAEGCKKCSSDQTCFLGVCVNSETHYHDAISLGFDWDYSNWKWIIVNESEPLWVESNWDAVGVELFRRANPTTEGIFLAAGIVEFLVSLVAVYYAKRYFLRNYKIF
jgi:nicastrin